MDEHEYTLEELIAATGFTKRQIRFYITKKLVPGAGPNRGPYAVYNAETLQRLRLIATLKDRRLEPTGRRLTLDEIGHALDEMVAVDQEKPDSGRIQETAADYLTSLKKHLTGDDLLDETTEYDLACSLARFDSTDSQPHAEPCQVNYCADTTADDDHAPAQDLDDLLRHLHYLLAELGSDTRFITVEGSEQWRRVTTPDIEFHVRQPDDHRARLRLAAMARELARLLEREDET